MIYADIDMVVFGVGYETQCLSIASILVYDMAACRINVVGVPSKFALSRSSQFL